MKNAAKTLLTVIDVVMIFTTLLLAIVGVFGEPDECLRTLLGYGFVKLAALMIGLFPAYVWYHVHRWMAKRRWIYNVMAD